jgi:hypothetical protein
MLKPIKSAIWNIRNHEPERGHSHSLMVNETDNPEKEKRSVLIGNSHLDAVDVEG